MLGAWFGGKRPDFKAFLRPLAVQLNKLRAGEHEHSNWGDTHFLQYADHDG